MESKHNVFSAASVIPTKQDWENLEGDIRKDIIAFDASKEAYKGTGETDRLLGNYQKNGELFKGLKNRALPKRHSSCATCSNNPQNNPEASGICHCVLGTSELVRYGR